MRPTIKDVAKRAGVGLSTVSRVLNEAGYYDEETGRKVRAAVEALGYRQNVHWTRLKRNSSDTVCFLLGNRESMNSMQVRMLVACEAALREKGLDLVFGSFRYPAETRASQLALPRMVAQEGMVDGVVLAGQHFDNLLEALQKLRMPHVLMGSNYIGAAQRLTHNTITYDDAGACYDAAQYIARMGHRSVAFVGSSAYPWFQRRQKGFAAGFRGVGLKLQAVDEQWPVSSVEYGRMATAQLLRQAHPPTAIFAANDEVAAGVWKELTHRKIRIPQEISLVGFGDREEFQILEPSLTSFSVFPDKLGAELANMLLQRLEKPGEGVPSRIFPCKLMERASCGPPPSRLAAARG